VGALWATGFDYIQAGDWGRKVLAGEVGSAPNDLRHGAAQTIHHDKRLLNQERKETRPIEHKSRGSHLGQRTRKIFAPGKTGGEV